MTDALTREPAGRLEPPFFAPEREMLESWLDFHRATLLLKLEGLSEEQVRLRSAPPSSLTLLGLVRHMTDVERNWFRRALDGEVVAAVYPSSRSGHADFDGVDAADVASDLRRFRDEVEHCRRTAERHRDLDTVANGRRDGQDVALSLRWIYVHMIEEYARHNGHADLLRERIDGVTGV